MPPHHGPVLIDTMIMLRAHRIGCWPVLSNRYQLETVEKCVEETLTGFQGRAPQDLIDQAALRASLRHVHAVSDAERAALFAALQAVRGPGLDDGERDLWAHALGRADAWILAGPDAASMRCGHYLERRDRLVSLEELLRAIGAPVPDNLPEHYRKRWLDDILHRLRMGIL